MQKNLYNCVLLFILGLITSCDTTTTQKDNIHTAVALSSKTEWTAVVEQLDDNAYPDNPDIEIRHSLYDRPVYSEVQISQLEKGNYRFTFLPQDIDTDTLLLDNLAIMEWIPLAAEWVKSDEYLTELALINQEWNRHQVRFDATEFEFKGGKEPQKVVRVDLARNCLNSYLWELIVYAEEDGQVKPYYHGWFDFPKDLYAQLFKERNQLDFKQYANYLQDWKDPENKLVNMDVLRTVISEKEIPFQDKNQGYYPLNGERKKKFKNILVPQAESVVRIADYLTDSTRFATFTPPGYYNTKDPRVTELSRFAKLEKVIHRKVVVNNPSKSKCFELEYVFRRSTDQRLMSMVIGGIEPGQIPQKSIETLHKGYQMPMGIANHSFYESYKEQQANPSTDNPYYALLLDAEGKWLDSHKVGIDGPLFHFDENNPAHLHLWILAFERHAFVGHSIVELPRGENL